MLEGIDSKIMAVGPAELQSVPSNGFYLYRLHVPGDFELSSGIEFPKYSRLPLAHGTGTGTAQIVRKIDRVVPIGPDYGNNATFFLTRDGEFRGFHCQEKRVIFRLLRVIHGSVVSCNF